MTQARRTPRRSRAVRADIRERLLEAALAEFADKGFDGASTHAIARRIGAHQPQINYHFASKEALWTAAVDHLFAELSQAMQGLPIPPRHVTAADAPAISAIVADMIRRFVHFAARHPELNRIMVHEATSDGGRLAWMTERHVRPLYEAVRPLWRCLRAAGIAAPIDDRLFHYVLVGAASLVYVNAPEARLLTGLEPTARRWVDAHADGLVAMLLPNAPGAGRPDTPTRVLREPRERRHAESRQRGHRAG